MELTTKNGTISMLTDSSMWRCCKQDGTVAHSRPPSRAMIVFQLS